MISCYMLDNDSSVLCPGYNWGKLNGYIMASPRYAIIGGNVTTPPIAQENVCIS